jgi:chaperonin GroES
MNLKPLGKKVILELIEKEKVSAGGIVLAKADPTEANRGTVIAIGPEVTEVAVGEQVLPNWNAAKKTKMDDQDFYFISEDDIVLVFED